MNKPTPLRKPPKQIVNTAKYGVPIVPSELEDQLPVITDILSHVSTENRISFESMGFVDTTSTPNGTYPGSGSFLGGVLLPYGRVFCVPRDSTSARIYDPVNDILTTPTGTYPGSS
jgi:hypothetical protein